MESDSPGVEPPLVIPVTAVRLPRPGFAEASLLTFLFWIVLIGTVIGIVGIAVVWLLAQGGANALNPPEGADPNSVASIPPSLIGPLAWGFPLGYAAGLVFTLLAFRIVAGKHWVREAGLKRLPLAPFALALIALPGFIVVSDVFGSLLYQAFDMEASAVEQERALHDLFASFHWTFLVLAVGIGPGFVEELWCRGFLGRGLVGRYGWVRGVALASLFFGLLHAFPPPYIIVTALMGAGLHFVYAMSRSLWVPIAVHLLNNSFAVLLSVGLIPGEQITAAFEHRSLALAGIAVPLLIASGFALWSARGMVTCPVPHAGIMVPNAGTVTHARPSLRWSLLAVSLCVALLLVVFM